METVECAICGSADHELLAARASHNIQAKTVICRRCGLVFLNPRMTRQEYEKFYSTPAYRKLCSNAEVPTEELDRRSLRGAEEKFAFFAKSINLSAFRRKKFLDVGCSAGYLPFAFKRHGWAAEGLEPTGTFADHGREKFGVAIMTGLLETAKFRKKYSFITLIHVFEHMTDPHAALRKLRSMLAPDGILYIEVPNVQEFYGRFEQSCDIAHPYFYSPATLLAVLRMNGFAAAKMQSGASVRIFARKGHKENVSVSDYAPTIAAIAKRKRDYYLKGYFIFTPLYTSASRLAYRRPALAKVVKKIARAYSASRLPFAHALRELGAVE